MAEPHEQLAGLISGYWHTQAIYVAAKLGLADQLTDGPRTAAELAEATGTNARALYGLLRALASLGIFIEDESHRFGLTPLAEPLRTGVPGSMRSMAIMRGEWQYEAWGQLLYTIQTGQSAFQKIHGMPIFEFLSQNPDQGRLFDDAMSGVHGRETAAMLDAYDFAGIRTLADIGGGNGSVLTAVLKQYPQMKGVLFDLPTVAERTRALLAANGLAERCQVISGNFFDTVPAGADAYLLRHILHDWKDEQVLTILQSCRKVMPKGGKLLIVEGVVPPGNAPSISKFFDLAMMVVPGGLERTEDEYRQLFRVGGFRLTRVVPTRTWISVIEGEPAGGSG